MKFFFSTNLLLLLFFSNFLFLSCCSDASLLPYSSFPFSWKNFFQEGIHFRSHLGSNFLGNFLFSSFVPSSFSSSSSYTSPSVSSFPGSSIGSVLSRFSFGPAICCSSPSAASPSCYEHPRFSFQRFRCVPSLYLFLFSPVFLKLPRHISHATKHEGFGIFSSSPLLLRIPSSSGPFCFLNGISCTSFASFFYSSFDSSNRRPFSLFHKKGAGIVYNANNNFLAVTNGNTNYSKVSNLVKSNTNRYKENSNFLLCNATSGRKALGHPSPLSPPVSPPASPPASSTGSSASTVPSSSSSSHPPSPLPQSAASFLTSTRSASHPYSVSMNNLVPSFHGYVGEDDEGGAWKKLKIKKFKFSIEEDEDISTESKLVPAGFNAPRPHKKSPAVTTLSTSGWSKPLIDTFGPMRYKMFCFNTPTELKRQKYWEYLFHLCTEAKQRNKYIDKKNALMENLSDGENQELVNSRNDNNNSNNNNSKSTDGINEKIKQNKHISNYSHMSANESNDDNNSNNSKMKENSDKNSRRNYGLKNNTVEEENEEEEEEEEEEENEEDSEFIIEEKDVNVGYTVESPVPLSSIIPPAEGIHVPFPPPPPPLFLDLGRNNPYKGLFRSYKYSGMEACREIPTPQRKLESFRLQESLIDFYKTKYDNNNGDYELSVQQLFSNKFINEENDYFYTVIVRDGIVDSDLTEIYNRYMSALKEEQMKDRGKHNNSSNSTNDDSSVVSANNSGNEQEEEENESNVPPCHGDGGGEGKDSILHISATEDTTGKSMEELKELFVGSWFNDNLSPTMRYTLDETVRFIPEYTNYNLRNTQPFHRGQIGLQSRKYDNDFPIFDYRKSDFGMSKFYSFNLYAMNDMCCIVVPPSFRPPKRNQKIEKKNGEENKSDEMCLRVLFIYTSQSDANNVSNVSNNNSETQKKTENGRNLLNIQNENDGNERKEEEEKREIKGEKKETKKEKVSTPMLNSKLVIYMNKNSRLKLFMSQLSLDKNQRGFVNSAVRVHMNENAHLSFLHTQELGAGVDHMENISVRNAEGGTLDIKTIALGGRSSRINLQVEGAPNSMQKSRGIGLVNKNQEMLKFEMFHHNSQNITTDQLQKYIVADDGMAVWRGRARIERDGVGAAVDTLCRVILLNYGAKCIAVPTLEIIPDDVIRATHGATISDLEKEPLLYFMSRGVNEITARDIMMRAFVEEVYEEFPDKDLKRRLLEKLRAMVPRRIIKLEDIRKALQISEDDEDDDE